jgi:hypothetical protein
LVGLIEKTNDWVVVLFTYPGDILVPSLIVYTMKGEILSKEDFLRYSCGGGDMGYYYKQYFRINPDLSIIQIDTTYFMKVDSVTYEDIDTTKIEINRTDFTINNKGEITNVKLQNNLE